MNNEPNDQDFEQQSSQKATSEVTDLKALLYELRELKEEIKNKKQITSDDIAKGVTKGLMEIIRRLILAYIALSFITLLVGIHLKSISNSPTPTITLPPPP